jgi:hypothetical protein
MRVSGQSYVSSATTVDEETADAGIVKMELEHAILRCTSVLIETACGPCNLEGCACI